MFCSTIIPTIGRVSLSRAVESVLKQPLPAEEFEIIIVNDSGKPLLVQEWMNCPNVRIIETERTERSVARNTGAAIARGDYLHFLDDDDWMLGDFLPHFQALAEREHPLFMYGGAWLMDAPDKPLYEINLGMSGNCFSQMMAGEWIPTGSYLIQCKTFFQTGGFTPNMSVFEDFDFCRRAALICDFAQTSESVLCILRGNTWDSTSSPKDPDVNTKERSLAARDRILSHPASYSRMWASAYNNYWRGHVGRAYLSSAVWNFKHKRYMMGFINSIYTLRCFLRAGFRLFSAEYWRGVTEPHKSTKKNFASRSVTGTIAY